MISSKYGCTYCRLLSFPLHVDQSDGLEKDDVSGDILDMLRETDNLKKVPKMFSCNAAVAVYCFAFSRITRM